MIQFLAIILPIILLSLSGCASTVKTSDVPTPNQMSPGQATIKIIRTCTPLGAAVFVAIQDGGKIIGNVAPCGELTWDHEAGYAAIITNTEFDFSTLIPSHVLIFPVQTGKTYILRVKSSPSGFYCEPENFEKNVVAYTEKRRYAVWNQTSAISHKYIYEWTKLQIQYYKSNGQNDKAELLSKSQDTKHNWSKLKNGMTFDEVEKIIGPLDINMPLGITYKEIIDNAAVMDSYHIEPYEGGAYELEFQDGKLTA